MTRPTPASPGATTHAHRDPDPPAPASSADGSSADGSSADGSPAVAPAPAPGATARPPHRDPALVLLVAAGGAVGALARFALAEALPPRGGWPVATLLANLTGAFLLGALLEAVARRGPETPRLRALRLTCGTGVLGGYTTVSALALDAERLVADGAVGTAVAYAGLSVLGGVLAALAGIRLARAVTR